MKKLNRKLIDKSTYPTKFFDGTTNNYVVDPYELIQITVDECIKTISDNQHMFKDQSYCELMISALQRKFNDPL